jgi:hypothetical protein
MMCLIYRKCLLKHWACLGLTSAYSNHGLQAVSRTSTEKYLHNRPLLKYHRLRGVPTLLFLSQAGTFFPFKLLYRSFASRILSFFNWPLSFFHQLNTVFLELAWSLFHYGLIQLSLSCSAGPVCNPPCPRSTLHSQLRSP